MITKKTLVIISLIFALLNHFIFHFGYYGPSLSGSILSANSLFALASVLILIFVYLGTNWRSDLEGSLILKIFDLMIIWIFICYFKSIITLQSRTEWKDFLLSPYIGLSLFSTLFFLVGVNRKYFSTINTLLTFYCVFTWAFSLLFIKYTELQVFLLMPICFVILTFPMQSSRSRILTLIISVTVIITSWTNRAGVLRIVISYFIVVFYYLILKINVNRKLINIILFCVIMSPFLFIYVGIKGRNVFEIVLGNNTEVYSQENIRADTRTFLYYEVFQDLKFNKAFIFGKGMNAGYTSDAFSTYDRKVVEVGFLQILLKSGILGFLLYMSLIVSAIFKALNSSNNTFIKFLGFFLASYILLFFIENVLAFNLLNIVIWLVVGMCHSVALRSLTDQEIKELC